MTAHAEPWRLVGWLEGSIIAALEYLDRGDTEWARRTLTDGLAALPSRGTPAAPTPVDPPAGPASVALALLVEAEHDLHELEHYADALAATFDGPIYIRLAAENAHDGLAYARAHCGIPFEHDHDPPEAACAQVRADAEPFDAEVVT